MKIDRVTITGADDNTDHAHLSKFSEKYPFVEWGILLSNSREGKKARYPSRKWIQRLKNHDMALSGHLCGNWLREFVCNGNYTLANERPEYMELFSRIQFNFHGDSYRPHRGFWNYLKSSSNRYIFQMDGVNDSFLIRALDKRIKAEPFFDRSGGNGETPKNWPEPYSCLHNGYAGGLGPTNIKQELEKISKVVGDKTIWIDMESNVRNCDDKLDVFKVAACLEATKKWVY